MTVDVLDPAPGPIGPAGLKAPVDLEDQVTVALGEEPVPVDPSGQRAGRGGAPAAEPARLMGDAPIDQAVFDAEFVAMMLTEAPWGELAAEPARTPPRAATGTRRAPPPGSPGDHGPDGSRTQPATEVRREVRRRPGPGPRSPPPGPSEQRDSTFVFA
jgi:hypothetical protein